MIGKQDDSTESINLSKLLSKDLTISGSFDIRSDIWASTFGKLLEALPIPALLVEESLAVIYANQACRRISDKYEGILSNPFADIFPNRSHARIARNALEAVFRTRTPHLFEAVLGIARKRIWGRMTLRSVRIMDQRLVLALIEDLTVEKNQLVSGQKHAKELQAALGTLEERNRQLKEEIAERQRIQEDLQLERLKPESSKRAQRDR